MKSGEPSPETIESIEKRSMTADETIAFLRERGAKPLEDWQPHQPILYVLEERLRKDVGPFNKFSKDMRPSVVRVDDPSKIHFEDPLTDEATPDRAVYELENDGGQVDYYAIDSKTQEITLVKTSSRIKNRTTTPYHVVKEALFMAADELFPKSKT